jgi:hypothetical protein
MADDWYSSDVERQLLDALIPSDREEDPYLQHLFDTAMFEENVSVEERQAAYEELNQYLWDVYGIDFEDAFDWEDYRAWYDAA